MFRNEIKFLFKNENSLSVNYIDFYLKKKKIVKLHDSNLVCNIYYDTAYFNCYFSHVDGNISRYKVRVRWYSKSNFLNNEFILEIKHKINKKNNKYKIKLPVKKVKDLINLDINYYVKKLNNIYSFEKNYFKFKPVLLNQYFRRYFYKDKKENRITLDTNIRFSKYSYFENNFLSSSKISVIENKFLEEKNLPIKFDDKLIILQENFSKYLYGCEKLNLIR